MSDSDNQTLAVRERELNASSLIAKGVRHQFERVLNAFREGQLTLTWPDGSTEVYGQRLEQTSLSANVRLHSFQPIRRLITDGRTGFAESYIRGEWSTDNLSALFALIMVNEKSIKPATKGARLSRVLNSLQHWRKRNSPKGSQRNIAYHYDLGNAFYRQWLDNSMSYSSALYHSAEESLEQAQQNKLERIALMLSPDQNASVLEVGCGWGSLARHLAENTGAQVHGISLSSEQLQYANENNLVSNTKETHAAGRTSFEYIDYRDVTGKFDHIVSIEMFEAVGQQYWETYFNKLASMLESGGTAVIQTITLLEERFDAYRAGPDFIQRYIFPGGMLPTKTLLAQHLLKAGFALEQQYWFGDSYARTLAAWRSRFEQASRDIKSLDFDDRFMRMWRYYLVYCETGFNIGSTDVGLLKIRKM